MTQEDIERRVKLVIEAQRIIAELEKLGLIRAPYRTVISSAMNTALKCASRGD